MNQGTDPHRDPVTSPAQAHDFRKSGHLPVLKFQVRSEKGNEIINIIPDHRMKLPKR